MKAPPFLNNLYRDLRDRRLLPLVVVLLIAIPALPLVLGDSTETPPPMTSPGAAALAEEIPTLPAVLAADPGLRDYRKRLDAMRSKNPFAQHFTLPADKAASESAVTQVADASGAPAGTTSVPSTAAAPPSSAGASGTTDASTATTSSTATSTSSDGGSGSGGGDGSPESGVQFYTYRLDVVTGRAGDTERRKNVKRLTVLPSQSNPVAMYMGAGEEGKKAGFLVSEDVVRSHGDGRCTPSPADCQLLTLRRGEERKFDYAPNGEEPDSYVIEIKDIVAVAIDDPRRSGADGGRDAQAAQSGLEAFLGI